MMILHHFPGGSTDQRRLPIRRRRRVNLVETIVCKLSSVSNPAEPCDPAVEIKERGPVCTVKIFPGVNPMVLL